MNDITAMIWYAIFYITLIGVVLMVLYAAIVRVIGVVGLF